MNVRFEAVKLIFQRIEFTFGMLLQDSTPVIKKRFTGVTPTHKDLRNVLSLVEH